MSITPKNKSFPVKGKVEAEMTNIFHRKHRKGKYIPQCLLRVLLISMQGLQKVFV